MSGVQSSLLKKQSIDQLITGKPTAPSVWQNKKGRHTFTDPSATIPPGRTYPIPAFFEYRSKPKEQELL